MDKFHELGHAAHDAGKMRSPALDTLVMQELEGMPVGTGAVEILTAWTEGWDAAHKEYTDRMAELRYEPHSDRPLP